MMMMLPNPIMTTPTMLCKWMIIVMMSQRSKQHKPCHPQQTTTTTKLPLTSQTTHHGKNSKDNIDNFPLYMIPKLITIKQKKNNAHDK